MCIEISLTQGYIALIDDEDFELVSQFSWCAVHRGRRVYALTNTIRDGRPVKAYMHRLILDPPSDMEVDHVNQNGLDNRRSNLRIADHSSNKANQCAQINNTSGFKGVTFYKRTGKWQARICVLGQELHLGYHDTPQQAAVVYNEAATEHFGVFARLNQIVCEQ